MNTRKIIYLSSIFVLSSVSAAAQQDNPNVLFIILDDAGYNDFGFMGSKDLLTPNIDALAKAGVVFTDAHVSASVSGPSRAGILTGRYQQRFGYECNPSKATQGIRPDEITIADAFKSKGYKTYAVGKWHQGATAELHPNKRGFDHFYGFLGGSRSYFYNKKTDNPQNIEGHLQHNGEQINPKKYLTYEFGDIASTFINQSGETPFMMYLAFNAPHTPMHATKEDLARFEGHERKVLAAMTYAVDKAIGDVVSTLKRSGKFDNTLIFFVSDNGGSPYNDANNFPLKGTKGNKFEGGLRIPFIMTYGDKIPKGIKYDGLTSTLDMFATAVGAANIDKSALKNPLDGVNLIPYVDTNRKKEPHKELFWRKNERRAMRYGDYKYIEITDVGHRLYNLASNLDEDIDLSEKEPKILSYMQKKLKAWETELVNPILWDEGAWERLNTTLHWNLMNNVIDTKNGWVRITKEMHSNMLKNRIIQAEATK